MINIVVRTSDRNLASLIASSLERPGWDITLEEPARPLTPLTEREKEILGLIMRGFSNNDIADHAHITERTVRHHISRLLQKFNVSRRTQLIARLQGQWPVEGTDTVVCSVAPEDRLQARSP